MKEKLSPRNPEEASRWEHTRRARRILDNLWKEDAREHLGVYLSEKRTQDIGEPSTALNIMASVFRQLAVIYDTPATVVSYSGNEDAEEALRDILDEAHWNGIAQRLNYYTQGLRESLLHVQDTEAGIRLGIVTPDQVVIEALPGSPEDIIRLKLGSYLVDKDTYKKTPIWEVWDISNPEDPRYYLAKDDGKVIEESPYIWKDEEGPFVPFVKYRAQYTDDIWDPYANKALINGTLDLAVLWSEFFHTATQASWPQRWGMDVMVPGLVTQTSPAGAVSTVETSPTSILMLKSAGDKAGLGQFAPGGDPKTFADAVLRYQSTVLTNFGISPSDLEASLAAQSGVAIQLKRSAQRKEALRSLPNYEHGDTQLMALVCRMNNLRGDSPLDPWDWRVEYHLIELSSDERMANIKNEIELYKIGVASMVDVLMSVRPSIKTREEAIEILLRVKEENEILSVQVSPEEA